jgi:hypothetical protein
MPKFARPNSYTSKQSNQSWTGSVRAANSVEAAAGVSEQLYISPSTLASAVGDLVPSATTLIEGVVLITDNSSPVATKLYVDNIAIAGAPAWSETVSGIGQLSTNAEAIGGTNDDTAMTPLKVAAALVASLPITGGAGSFTTLAASGLTSLSASATILTAGTALNLGSDNSGDAVNLGVGTVARAIGIGNSAAAHVITIGSVTGASQVVINSGTAGIQMASTGAGDITINSDDTLLLDADGVLELNSSAGVIGIGNDADAFDINVGTGAAARVITVGNNTGATQLVLEAGSGGLDIGTAASAQSITIGNNTGATAIVMEVGTGNFSLDGVAGSTYAIGSATTSGTITIGGTAQTGALGLGVSSGIMTTNLATGDGAKTLNIATGVSGNTVNLATGINTSAQVVNVSSGASAANSTVNILSGIGTAGTQTLNVLTGTRAGALNLATGAAAHVIAVGSASAGAVTVDTAAGISLGAATASDFSVSGALADLTIQSSAGRVIVKGEEAAVSAVELVSAAGGISASSALQLSLISSEAAVANSVRIQASAADGGIDMDSGTGGIAIDSTGAISLQAAAASDFSTSGAGIDLSLTSAAGRVIVTAGEDAADAIYLHADAGTGEKIRIHSDQGTGADSVELESDVGGITLTSGLASASAINLTASNASGAITHSGRCVYTPDSITSDNAGVAASVSTVITQITTDGDSNEDNVTLADGVAGQLKIFAVVAAGNAADSIKITPANMAGGTKITFAADPTGLGCSMIFDGTNWND